MKQKVFAFYVTRYNLDNGTTGGKLLWSDLSVTAKENARGVEICTTPCPYEAYSLLPHMPCVVEVDFGFKATNANGKSITQLVANSVSLTSDKSFETDAVKIVLK